MAVWLTVYRNPTPCTRPLKWHVRRCMGAYCSAGCEIGQKHRPSGPAACGFANQRPRNFGAGWSAKPQAASVLRVDDRLHELEVRALDPGKVLLKVMLEDRSRRRRRPRSRRDLQRAGWVLHRPGGGVAQQRFEHRAIPAVLRLAEESGERPALRVERVDLLPRRVD